MKKETKEMLKTILSNQDLIMKSLKIEIPEKKVEIKKVEEKKAPVKKAIVKKAASTVKRKPVKKALK